MAKPFAKLVALLTPKRRWAQFSLASMFVVVTVFCMWLTVTAERPGSSPSGTSSSTTRQTDTGGKVASVNPPPPNLAPTVRIVTVEPKMPEAGGSLTMTLDVSDPEGGHVTLEYRTDSNEYWQTAPSNQVTIPDLKSGLLTVYVRARDSAGNVSAVEQRPVNVMPASPPSMIGPYSAKVLDGRGDAMRQKLAASRGASSGSESAVDKALKWIAEHQFPDGGWSFDHRTAGKCGSRCSGQGTLKEARLAATGLALLPFLGQGQTHEQGMYKDVVRGGLMYLCKNMKLTPHGGDMTGGGGAMYGHGICLIALCEAYTMTKDQLYKESAQAALNFIMYAQDPIGGGWRYSPRTPGDTSVAGWQIMALTIGLLGQLQVKPATMNGAEKFLDFVQADDGATYGYDISGSGPATNAVGLLCRMHMGWQHDDPRLERGVKGLAAIGPQPDNMYFNYYATQVLCQYEGPLWEDQWNPTMRDMLVESQSTADGHENGSWYVKGDQCGDMGGRLYSTAMAAMTLEVYYRYLPLYSK